MQGHLASSDPPEMRDVYLRQRCSPSAMGSRPRQATWTKQNDHLTRLVDFLYFADAFHKAAGNTSLLISACFLAKRPVDIPVPEYAEQAVSSLYAQGLQGRSLEGEGVRSAALGRFIMAMLYMDDTTLVARSKVGLQSLTAKYIRFWVGLEDVQDGTGP